ncbi:MAG: acyl--CoA ligase, partial [Burkholderiaceae bacterium]|nr:acyl--CoA ligase [Burkholderiaceae bacterium]
HWLAILAAMRLGVITVTVYNLGQQEVLQMLGAQVLITERGNLKAEGGAMITMAEDWLTEDAMALPAVPLRPFDLAQPVRILLSSGTTGLPKKILYTNAIIGARIRYSIEDYGFAQHHRYMSGVGLDTAGAYVFSLVAWAAGGAVAFYDAALPFGKQIEETRANLLFMSPVQAANSVEALPADFPNPGLTLIVGGGRMPQLAAERAKQKLASKIWIVYGSTEAGSVSLTFEPDYARPEAVGKRVATAQIQIVDEAGRPVPRGTTGEVCTRGVCCVSQYLDDPEATRLYFRDGWFHPGDLGMLSETDELFIVGRVGDVMNLGGVKITPGVIEDALMECPGVKDLAAFSVPNELGVEALWVAICPGEGYTEQELHRRYLARFPNRQPPSVALVEAIPRNAMSKAQRHQLREMVKERLAAERVSGPPVAFGFRTDNSATANKESKVATVKINDKEYDFDTLPEEVKSQLASVQFIDAELHRMNLQRAALQTARTSYMKAVTEALGK